MDIEQRRTYFRCRYHKRRAEALSLLGDRCAVCGSEDNLHIDHIDPYQKNFNLNTISNLVYRKFVDEISKCQLLCSECHKNKTKTDGSVMKNRARGERVNNAKLTEEDVREIRSSPVGNTALATRYNVTRHTIRNIRIGYTWKHIK